MAADDVTIRVRALDLARFGLEMDRAADDVRKPGRAADETSAKLDRLNGKFDVLGKLAKLVKPAGIVTGLGAATGALSSLSAGAVALASALAPATGALAAYPALGSAAAQGLGVFKLATSNVFKVVGGLNQHLEKNSKAWRKLTPEAQRFAIELEKLKQPFRQLPTLAQKAMLPGFRKGIESASKVLGVLRPIVKATAAGFGSLAERAGSLIGSKSFGRDLQTQGERNVRWIKQAGTVALNLFDALRHVTLAVGPLVSWMMRLAVGWSHSADQAARNGRETGKLAAFFEKTRQVLSRLISIGRSFAAVLWHIGKAGTPLGTSLLGAIQKNMKAFAAWTGSAKGQNALTKFFRQAKAPLMEASRLVKALVVDFARLGSGNQGGLAAMLKTLRTQLLPALFSITNSSTKAFGPTLVTAITNIVKAFQPMLSASGPMLLYIKGLSLLAKVLLTLERAIPGFSGLLAGIVTAFAGVEVFTKAAKGLQAVKKGVQDAKSAFTALKGALDTAQLGMETMRTVFIANGGAADASNLAVLRSAAAAKLSAVWSKICAAATKAWTVAQAALNFVMDANPIVLVGLAIVALVGALVIVYLKVKWFRNAINAAWHWLKTATVKAFNAVKSAAIDAGKWVVTAFDKVVHFISSLPGKIAKAAKGMWDGIKDAFRSAINWIIKAWDKLHFKIGGWNVGIGPVKVKVPEISVGLPHIPELWKGGTAMRGGAALIGERGPEIIDMPTGASVHPLGGPGDDLAEKIAKAIARRMPDRPLHIDLFGDRVGHGLLRWLDDQAAGIV